MNKSRILILTMVLLGLSACQRAPGADHVPTPSHSNVVSYATLEPNLQKLKADFNDHPESVRLVYIVGATCPECLHGMDVLGKALQAERDNPRLRTYIVYVPTLGANAKDIPPTVGLISGNYVTRYWDPSGATGHGFETVLGIGQFAWDVYMVYAPGQIWNGGVPPKPHFWMDQLNGLPSARCLNADVFASEVNHVLAPVASRAPSERGL